MKTLIKYDFLALNRSKKTLILLLLSFGFALLSVISSRYMAELLGPLLEENGIIFNLPDPTLQGNYLTFSSDLYKNFTFVIMFVSLAFFMNSKIKGMMSLVLSKPISSKQYIISKFITFNGITLIVLINTYIIATFATYGFYQNIMFLQGLVVLLLYYVFVILLTSVVMLCSVLCKSYMVAAISTIGVYLLIVAINSLSVIKFVNYLSGLTMTHATNYIVGTLNNTQLFISIGLSFVLAILLVGVAIKEMEHQDFAG